MNTSDALFIHQVTNPTGNRGLASVRKNLHQIANAHALYPISDIYHQIEDVLHDILRRKTAITPAQIETALQTRDKIEKLAEEQGISILSIQDQEFPTKLRDIPNPPFFITTKGDEQALMTSAALAVVGTRKPTEVGLERTARLIKYFQSQSVSIISGLALGIDIHAHRSAMQYHLPTIAVLAGALNNISPKKHQKDANDIVINDGLLISEVLPGTKKRIQKGDFVERNRLQSGLADAVVIMESDIKGGTIHTAKFTLQQNRALYAFSPFTAEQTLPTDAPIAAKGPHKLIQDGKAQRLYSKNDLKQLSEKLFSGVQNTSPITSQERILISHPQPHHHQHKPQDTRKY